MVVINENDIQAPHFHFTEEEWERETRFTATDCAPLIPGLALALVGILLGAVTDRDETLNIDEMIERIVTKIGSVRNG